MTFTYDASFAPDAYAPSRSFLAIRSDTLTHNVPIIAYPRYTHLLFPPIISFGVVKKNQSYEKSFVFESQHNLTYDFQIETNHLSPFITISQKSGIIPTTGSITVTLKLTTPEDLSEVTNKLGVFSIKGSAIRSQTCTLLCDAGNAKTDSTFSTASSVLSVLPLTKLSSTYKRSIRSMTEKRSKDSTTSQYMSASGTNTSSYNTRSFSLSFSLQTDSLNLSDDSFLSTFETSKTSEQEQTATGSDMSNVEKKHSKHSERRRGHHRHRQSSKSRKKDGKSSHSKSTKKRSSQTTRRGHSGSDLTSSAGFSDSAFSSLLDTKRTSYQDSSFTTDLSSLVSESTDSLELSSMTLPSFSDLTTQPLSSTSMGFSSGISSSFLTSSYLHQAFKTDQSSSGTNTTDGSLLNTTTTGQSSKMTLSTIGSASMTSTSGQSNTRPTSTQSTPLSSHPSSSFISSFEFLQSISSQPTSTKSSPSTPSNHSSHDTPTTTTPSLLSSFLQQTTSLSTLSTPHSSSALHPSTSASRFTSSHTSSSAPSSGLHPSSSSSRFPSSHTSSSVPSSMIPTTSASGTRTESTGSSSYHHTRSSHSTSKSHSSDPTDPNDKHLVVLSANNKAKLTVRVLETPPEPAPVEKPVQKRLRLPLLGNGEWKPVVMSVQDACHRLYALNFRSLQIGSCVFLSNLPVFLRRDVVLNIVRRFGQVEGIVDDADVPCCCFVQMQTVGNAFRLLGALQTGRIHSLTFEAHYLGTVDEEPQPVE
ncbi:hypothetical protein BLNAU_11318 [Blattamonas nauphoetae]|uniref:RRM domain-containing protein n=1 Tax=Blattamonas nauphoetae TaxID=2049346 RepID=A0ABQ9XP03_9EUKA|nr:hypothetical protein BLNAU_11318 [Blattamonas nauphoetae]